MYSGNNNLFADHRRANATNMYSQYKTFLFECSYNTTKVHKVPFDSTQKSKSIWTKICTVNTRLFYLNARTTMNFTTKVHIPTIYDQGSILCIIFFCTENFIFQSHFPTRGRSDTDLCKPDFFIYLVKYEPEHDLSLICLVNLSCLKNSSPSSTRSQK
jgi:hypothetical protein